MITKKNNKSPLRYPGGKTRACKILDEIFNEYYDVKSFDSIISPFFGGGSFEFFIQNKYSYKKIICGKRVEYIYDICQYILEHKLHAIGMLCKL